MKTAESLKPIASTALSLIGSSSKDSKAAPFNQSNVKVTPGCSCRHTAPDIDQKLVSSIQYRHFSTGISGYFPILNLSLPVYTHQCDDTLRGLEYRSVLNLSISKPQTNQAGPVRKSYPLSQSCNAIPNRPYLLAQHGGCVGGATWQIKRL